MAKFKKKEALVTAGEWLRAHFGSCKKPHLSDREQSQKRVGIQSIKSGIMTSHSSNMRWYKLGYVSDPNRDGLPVYKFENEQEAFTWEAEYIEIKQRATAVAAMTEGQEQHFQAKLSSVVCEPLAITKRHQLIG